MILRESTSVRVCVCRVVSVASRYGSTVGFLEYDVEFWGLVEGAEFPNHLNKI